MTGVPPHNQGAGGGQCAHCGSNLTLEDLSQPACRYCGTVFVHVARAAEKVAIVHGLMGGMLVPPHAGGGPSPILPGVVLPGAPPSPPATGGPVAAGTMPNVVPGVPAGPYPAPAIHAYGIQPFNTQPFADMQRTAVASTRKLVFTIVAVVLALTLFFSALGVAAVYLLWQR